MMFHLQDILVALVVSGSVTAEEADHVMARLGGKEAPSTIYAASQQLTMEIAKVRAAMRKEETKKMEPVDDEEVIEVMD